MVGLYPPDPRFYDGQWTFNTHGCGCCTQTYHSPEAIKGEIGTYEEWLKGQLELVARFKREVP